MRAAGDRRALSHAPGESGTDSHGLLLTGSTKEVLSLRPLCLTACVHREDRQASLLHSVNFYPRLSTRAELQAP